MRRLFSQESVPIPGSNYRSASLSPRLVPAFLDGARAGPRGQACRRPLSVNPHILRGLSRGPGFLCCRRALC